ncbi:MAG: flagellar hook-length control protein FliK, partial [Thermodesulfobacteriota bacterium]|nr:flagellar hook-length control protein FliK [Thermodesulfobacteriota bacterium]
SKFAAKLNKILGNQEDAGDTNPVLNKLLGNQEDSSDIKTMLKRLMGNQEDAGDTNPVLNKLLGNQEDSSDIKTMLKRLLGNQEDSSDIKTMLQRLMGNQEDAGDTNPVLNKLLGNQEDSSDIKTMLQRLMGNQEDAGDTNPVLNKLLGNQEASTHREMGEFFFSFPDDLKDAQGMGFLEKFRQYLKMSGNDFKEISINGKGLQALEDLLVQAGFPENEVSDLIADLQEKAENGDVLLFDLMEGLSEIDPDKVKENSGDEDETILAISYLPFIETIMTALGIPEDISSRIISDAKQEGQGISLDSLIDGLQKLEKRAFFAGVDFKADPKENSLGMIFTRMGIDKTASDKGAFGLDEFVAALENMRKNNRSAIPDQSQVKESDKSGESKSDLLSTIMENLKKESGNLKIADGSMQTSGSTEDQNSKAATAFQKMKNDQETKPADFFSKQIDQKNGEKPFIPKDSVFEKEISELINKTEFLVNGKKNGSPSLDSAGKETEALLAGDGKKADIKGIDAGQSGGQFNGAEKGDTGLSFLKAKPLARNLPSYVANQVGKNLAKAVSRGDSEMTLQLKPPELGRIIMKIDNLGSSLKVSIVTENHAAKEILVSHVNDLKITLSNNGINLKSFDVEMGNDFQQSMADARQQSGDSGSGRGRGRTAAFDMENEMADQGMINIQGSDNRDGALHFVA